MNTEQMSNKLNELKAGMKIRFTDGFRTGKTFDVVSVDNTPNTKYNRTTIAMLEVGKPETRTVAGIGLNAGKMIEISNISVITVYAQKPYINFEIA